MVTKTYFTDEIATVLQQNYQGSGKPLLFLLHGLNTDSNNFAKPAEFQVLKS
jgi:Xaa-Pro dipeptidase